MKMIIGGAFQGKQAYAKQRYPDRMWIDGTTCRMEELYVCGGIVHFERYLRRWMEAEEQQENPDSQNFVEKLIQKNPELLIVTDEIGYGLVPTDAFERKYREMVGRICTGLASYSTRVDRVMCGIGTCIKGGMTDED